jgi:hypothetical protein
VLEKPVECTVCRRSFCKECCDEFIKLCENQDDIKCPNCRNEPFRYMEAHPMLKRALSRLTINCENASRGCTEQISYDNIDDHRKNCPFNMLMCQNFGCEQKVLLKEFKEHSKNCGYKTVRCEKCECVLEDNDDQHDCIKTMKKRFERVEQMMMAVSKKVDYQHENPSSGVSIVRYDFDLPALRAIKFNPQFGWQQKLESEVKDLPLHAKAVIVRFGITDINIRKQYSSLVVQQSGANSSINLTNYFFAGQGMQPILGMTTEVIMPWDANLPQTLAVMFECQQQAAPFYPG